MSSKDRAPQAGLDITPIVIIIIIIIIIITIIIIIIINSNLFSADLTIALTK